MLRKFSFNLVSKENILYLRSSNSCTYYVLVNVRTSFDSNPKTGMDSGPTSPNNKFVESRKKS